MVFPKQEFNKASVKDANLDKGQLVDLFNEIEKEKFNIHSLLLVRNGSRVFHAEAEGYTSDTRDEVYSVSKSFLSVAIGILIDKSLLNLEDYVLFFFKNDVKNYLPEYENLKVKHLLTMSVGQAEDAFSSLNPDSNVFEVFFNQALTSKPGETFMYNNFASFMLSAIVTKVTGKSTNDFLNEYVYNVIGMEKPVWHEVSGISLGATGLQVSSHDLARFGLLLLNDGFWDGQKVVSKNYLEAATSKQIDTSNQEKDYDQFGYGYQFWMNSFGDFRCTGYKSQHVVINKEFNLVFVCKANEERKILYLFENYVLKATKSGYKLNEFSLRDFTRRFKSHSHKLIELEKENK